MRPRHQARVVALRVLFQIEAAPADWRPALVYHLEAEALGAEPKRFAEALVDGVVEHQVEIDALLSSCSSHWKLDQMGALERAVLRLAVEELAWQRSEPIAVVIDEAVRLAKEMAGPEAGSFVNGLLGKVARVARADDGGRAGVGTGPNSSDR